VAFVVAHRSTLERLSRESGVPALRSLASAETPAPSARFFAVPFEALACDGHGVDGGSPLRDDRSQEPSFDRLVQPFLSANAAVVVIVETDAMPVLAFEKWVIELARKLATSAQADRSLSTRWRFVLIAPDGLDPAAFDALERLRQLKLTPESPASLFVSCHLMSGLLRVAGDEGGVHASAVWPEAVGELLVHFDYLARSSVGTATLSSGGSWYRAWQHVRLLPLEPVKLHDTVRALHAIAVVPSIPAQAPAEISAGIARLHANASVSSPSEDSIRAFAAMEPGEAERACRGRWDADSKEWAARGAQVADGLQFARGRLDTTHQGAGGHHGALSEQFWSRLHNDRSLLGWVSDGAFAESRDVARSVAMLGERWLSLFRFDADLRRVVEPLAEATKDLDQARDHAVGFRWRLLIATIVCLFVGFVLQSLVQTLAPAAIAGWLAVGGVAGSALAAVLLVAFLEHAAGCRARDRLAQSGKAIEEAIAAGISARVGFAASGEELQRWSAWLMATAMVRRRARRLRAIVDAATDAALSVDVEPSADEDVRASLTRYRSATRLVLDDSAGVLARGKAAIARWRASRQSPGAIRGGSPDGIDGIDSLVGRVAEQAAADWASFCASEDSRRSGCFREQQTWIATHGSAERARVAFAAGLIGEARKKLSDALAKKGTRTQTSPGADARQIELLSGLVNDELDALSVRTGLSSGSRRLASVVTVWVSDAALGNDLGAVGSSVAPEGALVQDLAAVALAHHDVEVALEVIGDSLRITERSVGETDGEGA
jgi:hypothetical protein